MMTENNKNAYGQTCLTSPFHMQWNAKNPVTAGTMYSSAGWKWNGSTYKTEEQLPVEKETIMKKDKLNFHGIGKFSH